VSGTVRLRECTLSSPQIPAKIQSGAIIKYRYLDDTTYYLNRQPQTIKHVYEPLEDWQLRRTSFARSNLIETVGVSGLSQARSTDFLKRVTKPAKDSNSDDEDLFVKINVKKAVEKVHGKKKKRYVKVEDVPSSSSSDSEVIYQKLQKKKKSKIYVQREIDHARKPGVQLVEVKKSDYIWKEKTTQTPAVDVFVHKQTQIPENSPQPTIKKDDPMPKPVVVEQKPPEPAKTQPQPPSEPHHEEHHKNMLEQIGLGLKLVPVEKKFTVKPKIAQSHKTLDRKLYDLGAVLTSKSKSLEEKSEAATKFDKSTPGYNFWKATLSEEGKSKEFAVIDLEMRDLLSVALKVYAFEPEDPNLKPQILGGLFWCENVRVQKLLDNKNFEFRAMRLKDAEDEKEITKTIRHCLKSDHPEIN